jgi:hypothetical protein
MALPLRERDCCRAAVALPPSIDTAQASVTEAISAFRSETPTRVALTIRPGSHRYR